MFDKNHIYIVAGDEMQKLMSSKFPERDIIPFREDLSRGEYEGFSIDEEFIRHRAAFWNVSEKEYTENISPIVNLDVSQNYILCFGEDECCKANLEFVIAYLKHRGYTKSIHVQIVDEYNLEMQREYVVE